MFISPVHFILLVLYRSVPCYAIQVPVVWSDGTSEVQNSGEFSAETFKPQTLQQQKKVPVEYFQYTAQKPQYAVDVATFHGVQSPEQHYKAYPVRPYTGKERPDLGKHRIFGQNRPVFDEFQRYANSHEFVSPVSSNFDVFHPYKAEEPALKQIYKDPILQKIRNDVDDNQHRLKKYETDAGKPNLSKDEYLESPEQTDRKIFPPYVPKSFEVHKPQRRPVYYDPPVKYNRHHQILNQKLRHPLHQSFVKIRPDSYKPLQGHLHNLRQHHAMTYDDERNQYPQLPPPQKIAEYPDGYDIYEKGKERYTKLRNNIDESINKAVINNRPISYENAELGSKEKENFESYSNEEEDFVPVKNYAQVRKTKTTKHLPKEAAFKEAASYDEIKNAPRLREAVKSTKAQTVYSEEGYEDAAYDHAGEQKHASDHEGHGGFLKEKEISGGKFKTPSFSGSYQDGRGSLRGEKIVDDKNWKNRDRDSEKNDDQEDYSAEEDENSFEADIYQDTPEDEETDENNKRRKRENEASDMEKLEVENRNKNFKVPEINLKSTFLTEDDILKLTKKKVSSKLVKLGNLHEKYPYYLKKLNNVHKHSPLRYAENLKLIPKKTKGGSEFYDSTSFIDCPDVDDEVDPVPEKLKKGTAPDDSEVQEGDENSRQKPRLKGLGDKIDCFKLKYFGENPLDSPFFQEEVISNPEPITLPSSSVFQINKNKKFGQVIDLNSSSLLDELKNDDFFKNFDKNQKLIKLNSRINKNFTIPLKNTQYNNSQVNLFTPHVIAKNNTDQKNITILVRKKRSVAFVYEPYKILKNNQAPDSKKTTTSSNISPLIKQLQSSRVVDAVTTFDKEQPVKRNAATLSYKNIGKNDRSLNKNSKGEQGHRRDFIDINSDARRGEPRYEMTKALNHKSEYTPVNSSKAMTFKDYNTFTQSEDKDSQETLEKRVNNGRPTKKVTTHISTTERPFFDVSKFLPMPIELQKTSASENIKRVIKSTKSPDLDSNKEQNKSEKNIQSEESSESAEEYDEYDEEEEEVTTTTTTRKPTFRRRKKPPTTTSTTALPPPLETEIEEKQRLPKLRMTTRFNNPRIKTVEDNKPNPTAATRKKYSEMIKDETAKPKYHEKKKKSSERTVVTDTKSYGNQNSDEDELRKDEVDAMIGIKQNMDEYVPMYEKEKDESTKESESEEREDSDEDDEEESEDHSNEEDESEEESFEEENATQEPTKQTLVITTEEPTSTTEIRSNDSKSKPIIRRKKLEFHSELPVNKSAPSNSQFKQDIKEIEIIKEMPLKPKTKKIPRTKSEMLNLYKDENLAKDINKLSDVEVFQENFDMNGPRHGGNYRSAPIKNAQQDVTTATPTDINKKTSKEDAETSQTEFTKQTELDYEDENENPTKMHGGNLKSLHDYEQSRFMARNAKIIEQRKEPESRRMVNSRNPRSRNKSIRENANNEDVESKENVGGKEEIDDKNNAYLIHAASVKLQPQKNERNKAAVILNNFARAVPILTTTPAYILDPSKRMYYYVDE